MCAAFIPCLTVTLQSVLLVVACTVHCHGEDNTTATEAVRAAEAAWKGEVEVVSFPLHRSEYTEELK